MLFNLADVHKSLIANYCPFEFVESILTLNLMMANVFSPRAVVTWIENEESQIQLWLVLEEIPEHTEKISILATFEITSSVMTVCVRGCISQIKYRGVGDIFNKQQLFYIVEHDEDKWGVGGGPLTHYSR